MALEQKEDVHAAPAQEDTGDVDDLVSVSITSTSFIRFVSVIMV